MFKPTIQTSEYVSLGLMLLFVFAFIAGQADATTTGAAGAPAATQSEHEFIGHQATEYERIEQEFGLAIENIDAQMVKRAVKVSIEIATELSHFRGEDE